MEFDKTAWVINVEGVTFDLIHAKEGVVTYTIFHAVTLTKLYYFSDRVDFGFAYHAAIEHSEEALINSLPPEEKEKWMQQWKEIEPASAPNEHKLKMSTAWQDVRDLFDLQPGQSIADLDEKVYSKNPLIAGLFLGGFGETAIKIFKTTMTNGASKTLVHPIDNMQPSKDGFLLYTDCELPEIVDLGAFGCPVLNSAEMEKRVPDSFLKQCCPVQWKVGDVCSLPSSLSIRRAMAYASWLSDKE
jgi:hypothetical protein